MAAMLRVISCSLRQPKFVAPTTNMSGKTVAITGPSLGGIGYQTALRLASFGANLLLLARNPHKATLATDSIRQSYPSAQVQHVTCDTADLQSIDECASNVQSLVPAAIDVLICNAGMQPSGFEKSAQGFENSFATCALGHHKLIHLLQPKRVVWVTGDIYVISNAAPSPTSSVGGMQAYARACLARLLLARHLKKQNEQNNVSMEVVCVHPGVINSNFAKMPSFMKSIAALVLLPVEYGAEASVLTASASSDLIHQNDPLPYYHNKQGWYTLPQNDLAMNEEMAQKLFEECDAVCGVSRA